VKKRRNLDALIVGGGSFGTALATGQPHQVFSAEHFCRGWHDYICTAVPVCDPFTGKILGVFDITGTISDFHRHAYGQLLHIVRIIETALFRKGLAREYLFNREAMQVLNTIHSEALVITDVQGTIRAATAAAGELFSDLSDQGPAELVTITESLLEGHQSGKVITPFETMVTANGELCQARVRPLYHEQMLLGLVAYRVGKKIQYDGATGRVTNDTAANDLLSRKYRPGWTLDG